MSNLLNRLINQLDTLIPFIAISSEDVFNFIQRENYNKSQQENLPDSYIVYRTQVNHSAFLLGYSYFEFFLIDLVREIYLSKPKMLPKDKKLKFVEILNLNNYESILKLMIEKEVIALFYQSMEKIIEYFSNKLGLNWPNEKYKSMTVEASCLRNCIIHNMNYANSRLSEISNYEINEKIQLNSSDVHSFGITARNLVRELYKQACEKYDCLQ